MGELTKGIQEKLGCMLSTDDVIVIGETGGASNWRWKGHRSKGFSLSG